MLVSSYKTVNNSTQEGIPRGNCLSWYVYKTVDKYTLLNMHYICYVRQTFPIEFLRNNSFCSIITDLFRPYCFWDIKGPKGTNVNNLEFFMPNKISIYPCPSVCSFGYRYMICPAISFYSFGATALIFCRMFIHIMEVCMSTRFWFSSNILKMTGSWT